MYNLKITTTGVLISILLAVCAIAVSLYTMTVIQKVEYVDQAWETLDTRTLSKISYLEVIQREIGYGGMIHQFKNYVIRQDSQYLERARQRFVNLDAAIAGFRRASPTAEEDRLLNTIESVVSLYREKLQVASSMIEAGVSITTVDQSIKVDDSPAIRAMDELSGLIANRIRNQTELMQEVLGDTRNFSTWAGVAVVALLATLLVFTTWFSISYLGRPLTSMVGDMNALANGNTDIKIDNHRTDEIGDLTNALKVFRDNAIARERLEQEQLVAAEKAEQDKQAAIRDLVADLRSTIDAVADGDLTRKIQLRGGNNELTGLGNNLNQMIVNLYRMAQNTRSASARIGSALTEVRAALASQSSGAIQQEASINETLSSLKEIKSTSDQTIEQASNLGQVAEKSRQKSLESENSVAEAVTNIKLISDRVEDIARAILTLSKKTQQIGEITDAVGDLAKQSKMLALNASIEAAKAGEAGQGFAVVAEEIRNLAEQSQESTAQVKDILQDIQDSTERTVMIAEEGNKQVAIGVKVVEDAGNNMGSLGEVVSRTAAISQQIVAIVRQEAAGIDQITTAVADISTIMGASVNAVRQTEQAMDDLHLVADELTDQVNQYKL